MVISPSYGCTGNPYQGSNPRTTEVPGSASGVGKWARASRAGFWRVSNHTTCVAAVSAPALPPPRFTRCAQVRRFGSWLFLSRPSRRVQWRSRRYFLYPALGGLSPRSALVSGGAAVGDLRRVCAVSWGSSAPGFAHPSTRNIGMRQSGLLINGYLEGLLAWRLSLTFALHFVNLVLCSPMRL